MSVTVLAGNKMTILFLVFFKYANFSFVFLSSSKIQNLNLEICGQHFWKDYSFFFKEKEKENCLYSQI